MKKAVISALLMIFVHPVSAETRPGECHGILHGRSGDLEFGGAPGEGEGICVISKAARGKILGVCSANHFCRVRGTLDDCKASGECTEIRHVTQVQRH